MQKTIKQGALQSVHLTEHCSGNHSKKNETGFWLGDLRERGPL